MAAKSSVLGIIFVENKVNHEATERCCGESRFESLCAFNGAALSTYLKAKKGAAVGLLQRLLFQSGVLVHMARRQRCSVILVFHEIPKESAEQFHNLLQYLSKHFAVLPLETLLARARRRDTERSIALALSFDDGLRNHKSVVYPVLTDLNLPATLYVCPGLIGRTKTTWTWEMWCRIPWLSDAHRRAISAPDRITASSGVEILLQWMKTLTLERRKVIEQEIRLRTPEFNFTDAQLSLFELMSWEELAELDSGLINIGSHTMTHCDLPPLTPDELSMEIEDSRVELESRLHRPVRDFCYPDGHYNEAVVRAVATVYQSGVTSVCGGIRAGDYPYTLKRIGADPNPQLVSWLLATHTSPSHQC